jgi:Uma2 family endonuclease
MTQAIETRGTLAATDQHDPYQYGWRNVERELPDGSIEIDQVPLMLEDVLFPEEGDHVTHNDAHQRRCVYLYNVLRARVAAEPSAVVLHDVRVKWSVPRLRPLGPDIAVIFGVRERKNWSTFDTGAEETTPALIIEVTLPETHVLDHNHKVDAYELAKVPFYIIVDSGTRRNRFTLSLLGYHQTPDGYVEMSPDARGWLWLEPVRVWLGIRENELFCYDEAGAEIGDYAHLTNALATEAAARIEAESRAQAAETRLRELEAELRRLRGEG